MVRSLNLPRPFSMSILFEYMLKKIFNPKISSKIIDWYGHLYSIWLVKNLNFWKTVWWAIFDWQRCYSGTFPYFFFFVRVGCTTLSIYSSAIVDIDNMSLCRCSLINSQESCSVLPFIIWREKNQWHDGLYGKWYAWKKRIQRFYILFI